MRIYSINLWFAYKKHENGEIEHAFLADDPDRPMQRDKIIRLLLDMMETDEYDEDVAVDYIPVRLPDKIVKRMRLAGG